MNLAIDIGNTLVKAAVLESGQVVDIFKSDDITPEYVENTILSAYPSIERCISMSTRPTDFPLENYLGGRFREYIRFGHDTPVPIRNLYKTPSTLGGDRLAAAVGAAALQPGCNVLIADFGTAITIDLLTGEGEFLGGNISPGASTRFRALHQFTGRLPLLEITDDTEFLGTTSASAIESGVVNGIVYEIEGYISRLKTTYDDLRIIFTGGDGNYFAKRLKNPIFATRDLVVYGLNEILEYNVR